MDGSYQSFVVEHATSDIAYLQATILTDAAPLHCGCTSVLEKGGTPPRPVVPCASVPRSSDPTPRQDLP